MPETGPAEACYMASHIPTRRWIARMLISWEGFDLNAKDWKGFTALDLAKVKGNPKMAKMLLELGVSSNVDFS